MNDCDWYLSSIPEDWLELLTDKDVFNESSLEIMKRMKDYGGKENGIHGKSIYRRSGH